MGIEECKTDLGRRLHRSITDRTSFNALSEKLKERQVRGASRPTVRSYLRGDTEPSGEWLLAAAEILNVRYEWLKTGEGEPRETDEKLVSERDLFRKELLKICPGLHLLSRTATELFLAVLVKEYALAAPDSGRIIEERELLYELAKDLEWLVLLPFHYGAWGFIPPTDGRRVSEYAVAVLHALTLVMPDTHEGQELDRHAGSLLPRLRQREPRNPDLTPEQIEALGVLAGEIRDRPANE